MKHANAFQPRIGVQTRWRGLDGLVAELAWRQHGVVARWQLLELGLGSNAVGLRLEQGRLHPLHRGVYTVGHPKPTREGRWMAAVLACGQGAVLSHRSAAALWGIRETSRQRIEITTPNGGRRAGLEVHRSSLPSDEVTQREGIPLTTVARTILDLGTVVTPRQVERALNEADVLRLGDETSLSQLLLRYPRRPGSGVARAAMKARQERATTTRSELEERFITLVDEACIPRPEVNAQVDGFEVDFLWRDTRLVVELDGRAFHHTTQAFERDRERDRILQAAGWRVIRVTWNQLEATPHLVVADLRRLTQG